MMDTLLREANLSRLFLLAIDVTRYESLVFVKVFQLY